MKKKILNIVFAVCLTASLTVGAMPTEGLSVRAAENIEEAVQEGLVIEESRINKLLTEDLTLPTEVSGLEGAAIEYSVADIAANTTHGKAVLEDNVIKVTRPYAGEGDYKFNLQAKVTTADGETHTETYPLTIREGLSEDSYAGYVYVCFSVPKGQNYDVQQIHFFLSEDGLKWTALNGCQPAFLAGEQYIEGYVEKSGKKETSVNYDIIASEEEIEDTVTGDASVLFPFEGRDQGVRDPYLIRGCRKDGKDSNKIWLLATDLNTHSSHYNGNKANNYIEEHKGDQNTWSLTSKYGVGSQSLFVWETEDWVHWTRRYIDVGSEIEAAMAWAPEAIYNPDKDNYLMYWSGRTNVDGSARNRLYCCETEDFVEFGDVKLYEQEPFYQKYIDNGMGGADDNDGYGNIDTSQLWVAEKDENGNITNPYGKLYRVVKDETRRNGNKVLLGVQLMSADSVLAPEYEGKSNQSAYDATDPINITPYEYNNKLYETLADLNTLTNANDKNNLGKAEIVYNWFKDEAVGNHFIKIDQKVLDKSTSEGGLIGNWEEGATMFKFIDRDEWCVMIDNYGNMQTRYEPFVTTDLSEPNSLEKMPNGTYGREGGDVGTHGGMIPITVKEYNTMIETYNDQSKMTGLNAAALKNYHEIEYIYLDARPMDALAEKLEAAIAGKDYSDSVKEQMKPLVQEAKNLAKRTNFTDATEMNNLTARAEKLLKDKLVVATTVYANSVNLNQTSMTLCTKATDGLKTNAVLTAQLNPANAVNTITWISSNPSVAEVKNGTVTAKKKGTAVITATAAGGAKGTCTVTVKGIPSSKDIKLNKTKVTLKRKKTFQIKVTLPKDTVCKTFTYKTSKKKVATVSKKGKVTAKKKGTAKITVTAKNNSKAKKVLTVKVK